MTMTRLLILGAVRERGRAHGYQVRRDLESWGVHLWASIQPGSIYHGLRRLRDDGLLVEVEASPSAGGPARTDYVVTDAGDTAFRDLLEGALRSDEGPIAETIAGIGFITELSRPRAVELLRMRVEALERRRARVVSVYEQEPDGDWQHHVEAVRLWAHTADAAIQWTQGLIERLEGGAYEMAGERSAPTAT
jgi:DNA-binding PadR family transcriptional regulator